MKKEDLIQLEIEDISSEGLGIGHAEGMAVFVKDTVIGDVIQAKIIKRKKTYAFGRLMKILKPSPERVEPVCPVARQCGGCQLQAMSYPAQLAFKEQKVLGNLQRIGGFDSELLRQCMEPIIGMEEPFHYRNKAQFPIGRDRQGRLIAGFYAGRTHTIIDNHDCALGAKVNYQVLEMVLQYMEENQVEPYDETTGKGLVRHVMIRMGFRTGEIMACLVVNGKGLPKEEKLTAALSGISGMTSIVLNTNQDRTNVILGLENRLLWGREYIEDFIGTVKYQISPLSFYQVNPVQTEHLYRTALEYAGLTGNETVWDLYCGIGTISLFLAQKAGKVWGVEIVPEAIEDARRNAALNGLTNTEFYVGKAEEVLPEKYEKEGIRADVIVIDPPRKGCQQPVLDTMAQMAPKRIVYVSCDSATLARDLKYLCQKGYELKRIRAVDNFCQSVHVETIVLLSHKSPDSVINVTVEFGESDDKISRDAIAERAKEYQPKRKITYQMIQEYVEKKYGFKVHTAYIAEVKRALGLTTYAAPNVTEELKQPRKHPPKEKAEAITEALKYYEVI